MAKKAKKEQGMMISPPWVTYWRKLVALFDGDDDVSVEYGNDKDETIVSIYVNGEQKSEAIRKILPESVQFGNVVLDINVIPNNTDVNSLINDFKIAFAGNKNVTDIITLPPGGTFPMSYVIFKKEVVQFFNDDLTDIYGNETTLNEEIAREVFGDVSGISFCTDNGLKD